MSRLILSKHTLTKKEKTFFRQKWNLLSPPFFLTSPRIFPPIPPKESFANSLDYLQTMGKKFNGAIILMVYKTKDADFRFLSSPVST